MMRSRVWMLSLAAALCVAGPALAYSWPTLFGLATVFGQEPQAEATANDPADDDGPAAMPYADECPTRGAAGHCDANCNFLMTWQRLWKDGRHREACDLAQRAAQRMPDDVTIRHAWIVSQIVANTRGQGPATVHLTEDFTEQNREAGVEESSIVPAAEARVEGGVWFGPLPSPVQTRACEGERCQTARCEGERCQNERCQGDRCPIDIEFSCPMDCCPLVNLFKTVMGASKSSRFASNGCCIGGSGCCKECGEACPEGCDAMCQAIRARHGQDVKIVWILGKAPRPGEMPRPTPVILPPYAAMPPLPPEFAPPPPPFIAPDGSAYIPVPVPTMPGQQQCFQAVQFEEADMSSPMRGMPADVRISQEGNRIHLRCSNYDADCQRIHGSGNGGLMLEGNVVLVSRRHGQTMTINAQRVMLNLREDNFVVEQAHGMETSRIHMSPVPGCPVGHYGNSISDERMRELHEESESGGQHGCERDRFWMIGQPTRVLPPPPSSVSP